MDFDSAFKNVLSGKTHEIKIFYPIVQNYDFLLLRSFFVFYLFFISESTLSMHRYVMYFQLDLMFQLKIFTKKLKTGYDILWNYLINILYLRAFFQTSLQ